MEEILNTQRVAEILSISPRKVGELRTSGHLKGYKAGRNTYYLFSDLIHYIKGEKSEEQSTTTKPKKASQQRNKPPKTEANKPPTLEEVKQYIQEKGFTMSAETFYNYYTANGWRVGKNKMKDWRASVRNWNTREKEFKSNRPNQAKRKANSEWAKAKEANKLINNDWK